MGEHWLNREVPKCDIEQGKRSGEKYRENYTGGVFKCLYTLGMPKHCLVRTYVLLLVVSIQLGKNLSNAYQRT